MVLLPIFPIPEPEAGEPLDITLRVKALTPEALAAACNELLEAEAARLWQEMDLADAWREMPGEREAAVGHWRLLPLQRVMHAFRPFLRTAEHQKEYDRLDLVAHRLREPSALPVTIQARLEYHDRLEEGTRFGEEQLHLRRASEAFKERGGGASSGRKRRTSTKGTEEKS